MCPSLRFLSNKVWCEMENVNVVMNLAQPQAVKTHESYRLSSEKSVFLLLDFDLRVSKFEVPR